LAKTDLSNERYSNERFSPDKMRYQLIQDDDEEDINKLKEKKQKMQEIKNSLQNQVGDSQVSQYHKIFIG